MLNAEVDSVKDRDRFPDYKRIHEGLMSAGHLHKGHSIIPHNSTIPSKYETFVVDNSIKKGFLSKSKRFQYEMNESVNPGPGSYQIPENTQSNSISYSTKGTGSFASKSLRGHSFLSNSASNKSGPNIAPNQYHLKSEFFDRKDFNKSVVSRLFQQDIAVKKEKPPAIPGPKYNLRTEYDDKEKCASSYFKSTSKRIDDSAGPRSNEKKLPGPGQYTIENVDKLVEKAHNLPCSSFQSKSKRDNYASEVTAKLPGPGTYHPFENRANSAKKLLFPKKHYLYMSAPALQLPPTPPNPGPGQYELSKQPIPKHFMSSSMFMSNSSRWMAPGAQVCLGIGEGGPKDPAKYPGPAHYQPIKTKKHQSFHYNNNLQWVY